MFRKCSFAVSLMVIATAGFVLAPAAGAAPFTASDINTPTSPTFSLWGVEGSSIMVTGTTTGFVPGEEVDIDCFTGSEPPVALKTGVPLAANGSFFVLGVSLEGARDRLCRLRAVPATTVPSDPSPFAGPLLATGLKEVNAFPSGPSEGIPFAFRVDSVGLTAGTSAQSIGRCGAGGFLENAALERTTTTFECGGRLRWFDDYQEPAASTRSQIQVDGVNAWTAADVNEQYGGAPEHFPAISYSASQDPATGNTVVRDDETFAVCSPTSCMPVGVRDARTIETTEDGHLVMVTDRYSSTDGEPHALDLLPESIQFFGLGGAKNGEAIAYRFPGQGAYATHQLGDEVAFGGAAPAVISVAVEGSPDGDQATGRGAIVLDQPASPAKFNWLTEERSGFELHQTATVPASGAAEFRTAYVQAYTAAEVEGLVTKVESVFAPPSSKTTPPPASNPPTSHPSTAPPTHFKPLIHVTKVKYDHANGTALLLARVNGPGRIVLSGKSIAGARTRSSGVGVVKLRVRAKGVARRRLNATGKAKVRAKVAFHATEGGEARTARGLTLRKK